MIKTISTAGVILALGVGVTACGTTNQDAYSFCNNHQGLNERTWEDDGDVECLDGTEYEADSLSAAGYYKRHKKTNVLPSGKRVAVKKPKQSKPKTYKTKSPSSYSKPKTTYKKSK